MKHFGNAVLLGALISGAAYGTTVHPFTLPGGTATCGLGIAGDGTIVGDNPTLGTNQNFVFAHGAFSFPAATVPGGQPTFLGINSARTIVGSYLNNGSVGSFVLAGGVTNLFTLPGASLVQATDINDAGTIVGLYQASGGGAYLGFIDQGGAVTTIDNGSGDTQPAGIDPSGKTIVGTSISSSFAITGFIYRAGHFKTLAVPGAQATFARGVDRRGRVSGTYFTTVSPPVAQGFLYDHGIYTTIDVPGATATQLGGINAQGEVTGCFTDATGTHGFHAKL